MAVKPIRISIIANSSQARKEVGSLGGRLKSVAGTFTKSGKVIGGVLGGTIAGVAGMAITKGFGRLKAIDQAKSQLRGLKLEGEEIESVMGSATKAVTGTAYGLDSAAGAAAGALGAGVKQGKDLTKYLTLVGDATAQSTTDFDSMALMMNKVEGAGKLTGGTLQQMALNGLQVMPMLTKEYGVNAAEMQKMVSAGEVSSADFKRILEKNIGGAAQESGNTFTGALANMQAALGRVGAKLLGGVFAKMPALFSGIGSSFDKLGPPAEKLGEAIGAAMGKAADSLKQLASRLAPVAREMGNKLAPAGRKIGQFFKDHPEMFKGIGIALGIVAGALTAVSLAFAAVSLAASPITLIVLAVAALGAGIALAWKNSETFRAAIQSVGQIAQQTFGWLKTNVGPIFTEMASLITASMEIIRARIAAGVAAATAIWRTHGATILRFLSATFKNIRTIVQGALKIVRGVIKTVTALMRGDWKGAWDGIRTILSGAWAVIRGLVSQGINVIKTTLSVGWNTAKAVTSKAWAAIKNAVKSGVTGVIGFIKGLPGKITAALGDLSGLLLGAGKAIMDGLVKGIESGIGKVTGKLKSLTSKIPKIKGPYQKDLRLLRKNGRAIMTGLLRGLTDGAKGVEKYLGKVTKRITKWVNKRYDGKKAKKVAKQAIKGLRDEYKALNKNAKAHDKIRRKIKDARKALADAKKAARDYADGIRAGVMAFGGVTAVDEGHMNSPTALVDQMRAKLDQAKRFADLIGQLTGKLNKTSLQELIDKGVEGGLAAAEALVAGGPATITEVNKITAELDKVGTNLGKHAATQFHQAGIDAAQGLVNGLLKQEKKLTKAAKKLAKKLIKAIKKELGIKSPSRVGKDLGMNFAGSIDLGANVIPLHRTGRTLARDLTKGFGTPTLAARPGWDVAGSPGARDQIAVKVHLTSDQISQMERGRRYDADITAYRRRGGAA